MKRQSLNSSAVLFTVLYFARMCTTLLYAEVA